MSDAFSFYEPSSPAGAGGLARLAVRSGALAAQSLGGVEEPSESQLVARAQQGDHGAFGRLVRLHEGRALALALQLVKDEHDAHEIVQEAFLRVYRGINGFAGDSSFFTWLYRIVNNLAIDFLRKPQRREREALDPKLPEKRWALMGQGSSDCDPFEMLANKELKATLERSVSSLPDYHRHVIEMRELQGLSYEEMAAAMGVSKGTIMSRLFHARQKLQRSLRHCHTE